MNAAAVQADRRQAVLDSEREPEAGSRREAGRPVRAAAGRPVRLIATDLDGTLLGYHPQFGIYSVFRDTLDDIRRANRAHWAICTGRGLRSFSRVFRPLLHFGVVPDFVIVHHAYIFSSSSMGYVPHWLWNLKVMELQIRHRFILRRAIPRLRRLVARTFPFVRVTRSGGTSITFRFETADMALVAANLLRRHVGPLRYLQVFHYRDEVDLRPVPFTKGLALSELARHLGVTPAETLAVGDGHNDISMMSPDVAAYTGCPANAQPEVIEFVSHGGGHIASQKALAGVLECIEAHLSDSVRSELPPGWEDAAVRENPFARRSASGREDRTILGHIRNALLFLAAAYAGLAVFASFGMVPMADTILRPYRMLMRFVMPIIDRVLNIVY